MTDSPDGSTTTWKRVGTLGLLCAALVTIASSDALHQWLLRMVDALAAVVDARPVLGMSAFVLLAAVSAVLAFFSSAVLVPVAVEAWGNATSLVLLWSGWWLGGMCAYGIGRSLGRSIASRIVSAETLVRFETRITARAPFGLIVLFQLALPSEVPGQVLGIARYSFGKYLVALGIAELPYALGTIYLGESLLERRILVLVVLGLAGAALVAGSFYALRQRIND
jgi:uncharacterized membrane protein YdjX (TVP38/TMEM64 family)